jgi:hypothetical protein
MTKKILLILFMIVSLNFCIPKKSNADIFDTIDMGVNLFFNEFNENGIHGVNELINQLEELYKKYPEDSTDVAVLINTVNISAMLYQRDFIKNSQDLFIAEYAEKKWEPETAYYNASRILKKHMPNDREREDFLLLCLKITQERYKFHLIQNSD